MGPVPEVKNSQFFRIPPGYAGYKPNGTPMDPRQARSFDEAETMLSLANNHYQAFLQAQIQGGESLSDVDVFFLFFFFIGQVDQWWWLFGLWLLLLLLLLRQQARSRHVSTSESASQAASSNLLRTPCTCACKNA